MGLGADKGGGGGGGPSLSMIGVVDHVRSDGDDRRGLSQSVLLGRIMLRRCTRLLLRLRRRR